MKYIRYAILWLLFYTTPFCHLYAINTKQQNTTVYVHHFLDNTEYFNNIVEGQTIFGFHGFLSYKRWICPYANLNIGLIWLHHAGQQKPWHTIFPSLSMNYAKQNHMFTVGIFRLKQQELPIIEPLLDLHLLLKKPYIEGFFFKTKNQRYNLAICLDWLAQLNKKQNQPESFKIYLTSTYNLHAVQKNYHSSLSFQLVAYHLGGQGITIQDFSLFCGTLGLNFLYTPKHHFIKTIQVAHYLLMNKYIKIKRPKNMGWGNLPTVNISMPLVDITLRYWYGHDFSSENMGDPLYQSIHIENHKVTYHDPIRHLLFLYIYTTYSPYKGIQIKIGFNPYYDFKNQLLEYGFSIQVDYLTSILAEQHTP